MQLPEAWLQGIRAWAEANNSVREVWLFGSRARGDATEDSDVDLALALVPPQGKHDWAFGNYCAHWAQWQTELEAIVGRHVSLVIPLVLWRRDGE